MKVLDFSTQRFDELNPEVPWEKEIFEFLEEWNSGKEFILSKTSGSTGIPKEIELPKQAMKLSAQMTGKFFGLTEGNSALLCLPVNFIAGKMMIVRAAELKLKLYCIEPKSTLRLASTCFDSAQQPALSNRRSATENWLLSAVSADRQEIEAFDFAPLTPMQVENSFDELPKIRILLIGGAPLADSLREKLLQIPTKSFESYGMTETITHIGLKKISEEFFTVLDKVKIRLDERDCLVIQTPYFEKEIITNDIAEIKNENQFKWLGRFDNVINSGGIKLFPEQIEKKLKLYIKEEFIVTSLPDEILGEKLVLVIEGASACFDLLRLRSATELRTSNFEFRAPQLGKYEIPKEIYYIEEFPRTESGKIKRNELIELIKH